MRYLRLAAVALFVIGAAQVQAQTFVGSFRVDQGPFWTTAPPELIRTVWVPALNAIHLSSARPGATNTSMPYRFPNGGIAPVSQSGNRFLNSASLRFVPVTRLEAEGYGEYLPLFENAGSK